MLILGVILNLVHGFCFFEQFPTGCIGLKVSTLISSWDWKHPSWKLESTPSRLSLPLLDSSMVDQFRELLRVFRCMVNSLLHLCH